MICQTNKQKSPTSRHVPHDLHDPQHTLKYTETRHKGTFPPLPFSSYITNIVFHGCERGVRIQVWKKCEFFVPRTKAHRFPHKAHRFLLLCKQMPSKTSFSLYLIDTINFSIPSSDFDNELYTKYKTKKMTKNSKFLF